MNDQITWLDIDLKGRSSGTIKTKCPACSDDRKNKRDASLSVNIDKGVAKCHHCERVSFRDPVKRSKPSYELPPQNEWQNRTSLSDKLVKYFEGRGISQTTLKANKITEEKHFMPQSGREENCIGFNFFEGATLVNTKFRSAHKDFIQRKNAKKIFYGLNDIVDADEVIIVEGEIDKLSFYEIGLKNCISVPNGAKDMNDVFENCEEYLRDVEVFVLAVDADDAGAHLEQELLKRLGKHRCKKVTFTDDAKDANEQLTRFGLREVYESAEFYPVEGVFTARDHLSEILDLHERGYDKPLKPKRLRWSEFNEIFSTLRGQLTVVTGIPTHGKSTFLEDYLIDLINDNDLKASFYSPEHLPMKRHFSMLAEKVIGRPFHNSTRHAERITQEELVKFADFVQDRIYLTSPDSGKMPSWRWLIDNFTQQIFRFGIDIIVIDAFNKVKRSNSDSVGEINDTLAELTLFAQKHNVMIFLVAHPTKMRRLEKAKNEPDTIYTKYAMPTLYDVKGTGDFYDQTHNGFTVYRDGDLTRVRTQKVKFKHQGAANLEAHFEFCHENSRFFPIATPHSSKFYSLIEADKPQESEVKLPYKDADDELFFGDNDEPPF